ncbi:hypothetical protein ABIA15_003611 [Sinorhizobium fredii]
MIRFILADLRKYWLGSAVVVLIVALAVALGVAVTLQERALRLGSARAADKFDLVIGAAGSENQLVLSSVFLQASPLPLMDGRVLTQLASDPRVAWGSADRLRGFLHGLPDRRHDDGAGEQSRRWLGRRQGVRPGGRGGDRRERRP